MPAAFLLAIPAAVPGQDPVPQRRVAEVQWPGAGLVEPPPPYPARIAAIITKLRLPVLIPKRFARYRSFDVVSAGPYDYTASIFLNDAKVWVDGSRQEVVPPAGALAGENYQMPAPGAFMDPGPTEPEPVLVNRKVARYGAGYVISAECAREDSPHCQDSYLEKLESELRLFGGRQ